MVYTKNFNEIIDTNTINDTNQNTFSCSVNTICSHDTNTMTDSSLLFPKCTFNNTGQYTEYIDCIKDYISKTNDCFLAKINSKFNTTKMSTQSMQLLQYELYKLNNSIKEKFNTIRFKFTMLERLEKEIKSLSSKTVQLEENLSLSVLKLSEQKNNYHFLGQQMKETTQTIGNINKNAINVQKNHLLTKNIDVNIFPYNTTISEVCDTNNINET